MRERHVSMRFLPTRAFGIFEWGPSHPSRGARGGAYPTRHISVSLSLCDSAKLLRSSSSSVEGFPDPSSSSSLHAAAALPGLTSVAAGAGCRSRRRLTSGKKDSSSLVLHRLTDEVRNLLSFWLIHKPFFGQSFSCFFRKEKLCD
ncbi:hypothetical protein NL676_018955 [Syzygium grande]|nr:hypothetical protein NL676_018955 [Syzygium grande]